MLTSGEKIGSKKYKSHGDKSLHATWSLKIVCMHDTRRKWSRYIHVALLVRGFDFWIYYFANIPKNSSLNLKFVRFKCEARAGHEMVLSSLLPTQVLTDIWSQNISLAPVLSVHCAWKMCVGRISPWSHQLSLYLNILWPSMLPNSIPYPASRVWIPPSSSSSKSL